MAPDPGGRLLGRRVVPRGVGVHGLAHHHVEWFPSTTTVCALSAMTSPFHTARGTCSSGLGAAGSGPMVALHGARRSTRCNRLRTYG
jgi:hypothetical protein